MLASSQLKTINNDENIQSLFDILKPSPAIK